MDFIAKLSAQSTNIHEKHPKTNLPIFAPCSSTPALIHIYSLFNGLEMSDYANKTYLDFNDPTVKKAQQQALADVRAKFGQEYKNYIGGEWVKGALGTFESINPSNIKEVIGSFPLASKEQALGALDTAWEAFETWKYVPAEDRVAIVEKAIEIINRRRLEINAWMISEAGKNYLEADADTCEAIDFLDYYCRDAIRLSKGMPVIDSWGDHNQTVYIPIGAGVSISPWNFPFAITIGMAVAPILAGNTVVAKPSPDTPKMGQLIAEIFEEAGLPAGVFNFITGDNMEVGENLVQSPKTRFITFTGSLAVGKHIYEVSGQTKPDQIFLKRVVAELGGKNAVVVDEDADLDAASTGIVQAAFGFQGQKCSAASRVIAHEKIYDKLLELTVEKASKLEIGDAKDNYAAGAVVNQKALDKILSYVEIGKKEGRLVHGGKLATTENEGFYVEPTIFADVEPNARIAQEEIFGPVTAFIKVCDFDEAMKVANSTMFGLTGAYFSRDEKKIERAMREFHVGNLYINRKNTGALVGAQPFGGFNMSGTDGKAGGHDYLLYFLQPKSMTQRPIDGVKRLVGEFTFEKK